MRNVNDYLAHYGIKGQKWGIRRFQNADGTWTEEGRVRYGNGDGMTRSDKKAIRAEYRADNKQAFEYGKSATIAARAASYAKKKEEKAQKKYDRNSNEKNAKKLKTATELREEWEAEAKRAEQRANDHMKSLVKKYGSEAVSSIKYDKQGRVNEKIHTGKDYVVASLKNNAALATSIALGSKVSLMWYPSTKNESGKRAYNASRDAKSFGNGTTTLMLRGVTRNQRERYNRRRNF